MTLLSRSSRVGRVAILMVLLAASLTLTAAGEAAGTDHPATPSGVAHNEPDTHNTAPSAPAAATPSNTPIPPAGVGAPLAAAPTTNQPTNPPVNVATTVDTHVAADAANAPPATVAAVGAGAGTVVVPPPATIVIPSAAAHDAHGAHDHDGHDHGHVGHKPVIPVVTIDRAGRPHAAYAHAGHLHATNPEATLIQHGGHTHTLADAEEHGGIIFITMVVTMCLAQLALVVWKKYHPTSFDQLTLVGLWLFPIGWSIYHGIIEHIRMITLWSIFSIACGIIGHRTLQKPIARTTPRLVYKYFYFLYRISYSTAIAGYIIMMSHFLGLSLLPFVPSPSTALLLGFYGLYFGVLGRDLANVCSQTLAVNMGYIAKKGEIPQRTVPMNTCAICDSELVKSFRPTAEGQTADVPEKIYVLGCGHQFHDFCLRGWTMIGKRDTCANCNEKVVLQKTMRQPWESTSVAWAWLLDALRYLIVYNPLVLALAQGALWMVY